MHAYRSSFTPGSKLSPYVASIAYDPVSPLRFREKTDCCGLPILSGTFPDFLLPEDRDRRRAIRMSQAFFQLRLHSLLDSSVGSKDEKRRCVTSDREQGSDGSDEPHRLPRNQHSRPCRLGSLFAWRDKSSYPRSPHGNCALVRNPEPRLGQNLSADHIRRADFALIVADGDVLSDRTSIVVERVCVDDGAVLGNRHIHFPDDLALVVVNQH